MILKHKDDRTEDIQELNRLLSLNISSKQKTLVERELKCLMAGNSGESNSAYHLDFKFKHSKNWAVIHDLRIEHRGLVAQIDHLVINRFLEMYVLESKNYFYGIKITDDGEFLIYNGKTYQGIESPIEQNIRHVELLQKSIEDRKLAPTRLCVPIPIVFNSYVLVAPNSRIDRPQQQSFDTSQVVKADAFVTAVEKEVDQRSVVSVLASATKIVSSDTLEEFAQKVTRLHRPGSFNYAAKFGIDESAVQLIQTATPSKPAKPQEQTKSTSKHCDQCGSEVDEKVAYFCRMNKSKFNGKVLCRTCQQQPQATEPQVPKIDKKTFCESCNQEVDSKVVFYCRMNKQKFDGKILCRDCQQVSQR